ncbi:MAG: SDR family oxidoreductase [Elusimicrobia bacterium]|nr:SDR family oxidoreductase [Elusimicrobiota bacterium]
MFSEGLFRGKVACVTGSGTGIGKAIALEFARLGCDVVLAARNAERLEAAAGQVRALGRRALVVPTDVAEHPQVKRMVQAALTELGGLDFLVNNAAANFIRPTRMMTALRWKTVVDIVLNGTFYGCLEAGKAMLGRGGGSIVNIVAAYAWTGAPGIAASASAKAGVVTLTRTLGAEWASGGVRVNAIAPGLIDTPQTRERLWPTPEMSARVLASVPMGRFGEEADVANLAAYLCSPMGRYITGETVVADGGQHLGRGALDMMGELKAVRRPRGTA